MSKIGEINATDARSISEFDRVGYHYTKIENESNDKYMVWELSKDGEIIGYELWKFKRYKNPDGSIVWAKPCDEDFGRYGWFYPSSQKNRIKEKINYLETIE